MIDQMIHIHNQLFGSPDLVLAVSSLQITVSFVVPYFLGNLHFQLFRKTGAFYSASLFANCWY